MENKTKKTYTLTEIAEQYDVQRKTMYNWISPIKQELLDMYPIPKQRLSILLPKQVERIKELLG